jgi:hypothetical protein
MNIEAMKGQPAQSQLDENGKRERFSTKRQLTTLGAVMLGGFVAITAMNHFTDGGGIKPEALATELEQGDWDGAKVSEVDCVHKADKTYTCMGTYAPTPESVRESMPIAEDWSNTTLNDYIAAASGPTSWEVTVGDDGNWIAEPKS